MDGVDKTCKQSKLDEIGKRKEYNILLLGQTGVGKSTFINAFINYLTFATLEEAQNADPIFVIPVQFALTTVEGNKFKRKSVNFGKDSNEVTAEGQSATQQCRSYTIEPNESLTIRLIDTPGIGDTRGISQDKANMQNLMHHLAQLENKNLHMICILMKPNESRLTPSFNFCLQELAAQLHKDAVRNIVFLFTHSRSTNYVPGETMVPLNAVLEKINKNIAPSEIELSPENAFFVDSESFTFLLGLKCDGYYDDESKNAFAKSWDKSVSECKKICNKLAAMEPHDIDQTVCMNDARNIIFAIAKPMADVTQSIADNMKSLDEAIKSRDSVKGEMESLKDKKYFKKKSIKLTTFDQPRTACNYCAKIVDGRMHFEFFCHDPCYLTDIPQDTLSVGGLLGCYAMDGNYCRECKCHYTKHMHVYYSTERTEIDTEDEGVKADMEAKGAKLQQTQDNIHKLEDLKVKFEEEAKQMMKASAAFAHFLKSNAIIPYNDSFQDYMGVLIENEKRITTNPGTTNPRVAELEKMLCLYMEEKKIFDQATNQANSQSERVEANQIPELVASLFKMPQFGAELERCYKANRDGINREHLHHSVKEVPVCEITGKNRKPNIAKGFSQVKKFFSG